MQLATNTDYQKLQVLLAELPPEEIREVYHFTLFLHEHTGKKESAAEFPAVPADHLRSLAGLIAVGGDALRDTEALYE